MNTYKITFKRENGTMGYDNFVAANEAQARRDFKEVYRHGNGEIIGVELASENVTATKEQERKALEKIRKIVAELGEGSYVGTALEGCLEDAESNIENDFGCSMKQRYEEADREAAAALQKVAELEAKLRSAQKGIDELIQKDDERKAALEKLSSKILSADDLENLLILAVERKTALDEEVKNAAGRIVESAGEPESAAFKNAVSDHRAAKRAAEQYTSLIERAAKAKQ